MRLIVDHLPKTARLLVALIGLPATLALVKEFGGQMLRVTKEGPARAWLDEVIGSEAAEKLDRHFQEEFPVPKCEAAIRAVIHDELRVEFDRLTGQEGLSARKAVKALVKKFGYTERHNWRLLGQADTGGEVVDSSQGELF